MNFKNLVKLSLSMLFIVAMLSGVSFAQSIYVDATNGNDVTGLGSSVSPYASIAKGLSKLQTSGGTVVIRAGSYDGANLTGGDDIVIKPEQTYTSVTLPKFADGAAITISLEALNGNNDINVAGSDLTFDIKGGTLNIVSESGKEYLTLGGSNFTLGSTGKSVSVNLAAITGGTNVVLPAGATITMYGTSSFAAGKAPTKTTNINVTYLDEGSVTAGPEANYGDYGNGKITVNKGGASDVVTFPYNITSVNGIDLTDGGAVFQGAVKSIADITIANTNAENISFASVTLGSATTVAPDFAHKGKGAVTISGDLNLFVLGGGAGAAATDLGSIQVTDAAGSLTVNGTTTWTGADLGAGVRDFSAVANAVDNAGTLTLGAVKLVASNATGVGGPNNYKIGFVNTLTMTSGAVTSDLSGDQNFAGTLYITNNAASKTLTLAGGNVRGNLTNTDGKIVVNGTLTLGGVLTNAAGKEIALNADLILNAAQTNVLGSASKITGSGKVVVKGAAVVFNNPTNAASPDDLALINNMEVASDAGSSAAFTATNDDGFKVTGDLTVNKDLSLGDVAGGSNEPGSFIVDGTMTVNAGTVTVDNENDAVPATTTMSVRNLIQNGGTISLDPAPGAGAGDGGILKIYGTFNRVAGTFTATDAQSIVEVNGTAAQSFNGGPNFQLTNMTVSNTGGVVELKNSIRASGTVTVNAGATVELGNLNIVLNADGAKIDNKGTIKTTGASTGAVIFGGSNFVAGGAKDIDCIINAASNAVFSNIIIDVNGVHTVSTTGTSGNIRFNGTLYLYSGDLVVDDGTATVFDFAPTGSNAVVKRNLEGSTAGITLNGDTFDGVTGEKVDYDLTYEGVLTGNKTVNTTTSVEYVASNVRNLTINAGGTSHTITLAGNADRTLKGNLVLAGDATTAANAARLVLDNGDLTVNGDVNVGPNALLTIAAAAGADVTVKGNLSVAEASKISGGNATSKITLGGDNTTASINGNIDAVSIFTVTGKNVTINGSKKAGADIAELPSLVLGTDASATVADIQAINGVLTTGDKSTLTLGLVQNSADPADADNGYVNGLITLGGTSLTLTSDIVAKASVDHNLGTFDFGSHKVTVTGGGTYDRADIASATYPSTDGTLVLNDAGVGLNFHGGSIPNIEIADNVTLAADLIVSKLFKHTAGALSLTGNLTLTGDETYTNGTYSGTGKVLLKGVSTKVTAAKDFTIPEVELNSTGTVTLATSKVDADNKPVAIELEITKLFTQTAGDLALGINNLSLSDNGADDNADYTRAAGSVTATTGVIEFAGDYAGAHASVVTPGAGLTIPNLVITGEAGIAGTNALTVSKTFGLSDNFNIIENGRLIFGDGITITRSAGAFDKTPAFPSSNNTNVIYTAALTTAKELPAIVNNLTVNGGDVVLAAPVKVNGKIELVNKLTATDPNFVTLGVGASFVRNGGQITTAVKPLGAYNLTYAVAHTVSDKEWPTNANISNLDVQAALTNDGNDRTVNGNITLSKDASSIDINAKAMTVKGNITESANSSFFTNGTLVFGGSSTQSLKLNKVRTVANNLNVQINKTNTTDSVKLVGKDLQFVSLNTNENTLDLAKGLFVTDAVTNPAIILVQDEDAVLHKPLQGFKRTSGVIVGNVTKYINNTKTVQNTQVVFPTGTEKAEYRPLSMFFKTAPQSSMNLTVKHVNAKPLGSNGFPITAGSKQITNYPNFFWYVSSDQALAPSYKYDMSATAEGYSDYKEGIQNVRFIRRDSGSVANEWVLQGADNSYDNSAFTVNNPSVKVIDAMGGITSQGSIFTYSQANKAPVFAAADHIGNVTKAEGDTLTQVYKATDPDFGQTVTLSKVQIPEGSTFDPATGKFSWIIGYDKAGKHVVQIKATDSQNASYTISDTITVNNSNRAPVLAKMGKKSVSENADFSYQYVGTDADGDPLTYSMTVGGDATVDTAKLSAAGKLTWKPGFGNAGMSAIYTVKVSDGTLSATVIDTIVVTKTNRAPEFASKFDSVAVKEGELVAKTFVAVDPDGTKPTYTVVGTDSTAKIDPATGAFAWTPSYKSAGTYTFTVTASDGSLKDESVLKVVVSDVNVAPVFKKVLANQTVAVGDTVKFQYTAEDLDGDALEFGLINAPINASIDAKTGMFTWIPKSEQTAIYVIKATVTDPKKLADTVSTEVLVKVVTVAVSGKVTYDNSTVAVPGVVVTMKQGETTLTDTTDANGNYNFDAVNAGTYAVSASKKAANFDAVNATDALLAALYGVEKTTLSAAQKLAADVIGESSDVNASDAMVIVQKFVDPATKFKCADWLFVPQQVNLAVGTKSVVNNISAILAGDVDRSMANGKISKAASFSVNTAEAIKIAPKATFALPIKVAEAAKLGAVSMQITYPTDLVKFEGVSGADGMMAKDVNGTITIGWFNTNGMNLKAADVLASLKFSATEKFAKGQTFTVSVANNSEFADANGKAQTVALQIANVEASVPTVFALNQNYPNPFNPSTTIAYDLPVDGKVTLAIYNSLGQVITTLVNEIQTAGAYKYNWNAAAMSSGVYYYRITVEGQKGFSATHKMILMK